MIEDEEVGGPRRLERPVLQRPGLDPLSVADLHAYIAELRTEIVRAETAIEKKQGARGHADSFFKTP